MVSVIILSYNTEALLQSCVRSVYERLKKIPFEIIVVDNASIDKSVEMVKSNFPDVKVIANKNNLGFAKGINRGFERAQGEFLLFLNSDAKLLDGNVKGMLELLEEDKSNAIVGGKLENPIGATSKSFGRFPNLIDVFQMLFFDKSVRLANSVDIKVKEVDWVSGGFMLIRKDVFEELNGFDEQFFMYVEDIDLCFRARKKGYKVYYFPKAEALHEGQGSSSRSFAIAYIYQGLLYFYKKHKSSLEYALVKSLLVLKAGISILLGLATRNAYLVQTYRKAIRFAV